MSLEDKRRKIMEISMSKEGEGTSYRKTEKELAELFENQQAEGKEYKLTNAPNTGKSDSHGTMSRFKSTGHFDITK
jgi:hypothetical protein